MSRADRDAWIRQLEWVVAALVTALSVGLHVTLLQHAGALWRDEVNSVNLVAAPTLSDLWRLSEFDSVPLLWPLLLRGFAALVTDDFGLRTFGFVTGLLVLGALWFADRRLARFVPLLGLALVGLNPEVVRWGDSIRAYGLGTCLIVLAFPLIRRAAHEPTPRRIAAASIATVAAVQCLFHNVPLVAAVVAGCAAAALRRGETRRALVPIGIGAVAALTLLPYVVTFRRVAAWSMLAQRPVTLELFASKLQAILEACGSVVFLVWIGVGLTALIAVGVAFTRRGAHAEDYDAQSAGATFAATLFGYPLFLLVLGYPTQVWYYIPPLALLLVTAEASIQILTFGPKARICRVIVAIAIAAASLKPAWSSLQARQTTIDAIASRLNAEARPGDLVVVGPWYFGITFERYYRGKAEWTTAPPLASHAMHRFDLVKQQMMNPDAMAPVLDKIGRALAAGGNVWVVGNLPASDATPPRLPPPPLPNTGWRVTPYTLGWGLEAGAFLQRHALETRSLTPEVHATKYERARLIVASGWKP